MIRQTLWALMAAVTAAALTPAPDADAATFRVTSRIYEGDNLNASSEHWILFDNGLIYDLPRIDDRFVTVFDPAQKRVTLLDRQGRVQTRLNTDDLLGAAAQVRADAATEQQKARIGVDAKVEPSRRVIGYSIRFADFEYHATTQQPDDPDVAADYGRFTLLASQLNIVRHLGPPPFARMTLFNTWPPAENCHWNARCWSGRARTHSGTVRRLRWQNCRKQTAKRSTASAACWHCTEKSR